MKKFFNTLLFGSIIAFHLMTYANAPFFVRATLDESSTKLISKILDKLQVKIRNTPNCVDLCKVMNVQDLHISLMGLPFKKTTHEVLLTRPTDDRNIELISKSAMETAKKLSGVFFNFVGFNGNFHKFLVVEVRPSKEVPGVIPTPYYGRPHISLAKCDVNQDLDIDNENRANLCRTILFKSLDQNDVKTFQQKFITNMLEVQDAGQKIIISKPIPRK